MRNSMKKVPMSLVTGGAGFIGSHVAVHLIKMGHKVIILDDLSGGFKENVPQGTHFIKGSITDNKLLKKLFLMYQFDYVYHLAAYAAEGLSHFIRNFNYTNNLIGTSNLINLSVEYNIKRFIFTSSIAVYGTNQTPFSETTIPHPEDPYGIAKYAIELDLKAAYNVFGLKYTVFRPHNVYGEKQNINDPFRNVIGIFMNRIIHKKPLPIFGDGKQTRAFSYIGDVAPYIAECIKFDRTESQIFNIGADIPTNVLNLAHLVTKEMGVEPNIVFYPPRIEVKHAFSNHNKLNKYFHITSTTSLKEGIKKMAEWVRKSKIPNTKNKIILEIDKKLPVSWQELFDK